MLNPRNIPGIFWRRLCQAVCLLLFFVLFFKTDYTGADHLEYAVNVLFRIDPLLAACAMLAAKAVIVLMLPALAVVALTLLLGRFFCGWVCPMGALIDLAHRFIQPRKAGLETPVPQLRYGLLVFVLAGSFFGLPMAGYLDPFSLLVRGLALAIYPSFNHGVTTLFTFTYQHAPAWVNTVTEPVYALLRATVLTLSQKYFSLAYFSALLLLAVFCLELWQRRLFCRSVCPLGALLGLLARAGLLHGQGGAESCKKCHNCRTICRMGAIDEDRRIAMEACTLCLECLRKCPRNVIAFDFKRPVAGPVPVSLSRRTLVGALASGAILPLFSGVRAMAKAPSPELIRPPGALAEDEFLGRCVRCGECMKVCIGNALQPTFVEAGLEGIFTPKLVARVGYCEFNCTLCGQVCPTGAIKEQKKAAKQRLKIGNAFFDKNLCLPYARGIPCIVCEEHCPTPDKAIKFRQATVIDSRGRAVQVLQPYLIDELCIGCGICEYKCPLPDRAAVRITSAGEARNPAKPLPVEPGAYR